MPRYLLELHIETGKGHRGFWQQRGYIADSLRNLQRRLVNSVRETHVALRLINATGKPVITVKWNTDGNVAITKIATWDAALQAEIRGFNMTNAQTNRQQSKPTTTPMPKKQDFSDMPEWVTGYYRR